MHIDRIASTQSAQYDFFMRNVWIFRKTYFRFWSSEHLHKLNFVVCCGFSQYSRFPCWFGSVLGLNGKNEWESMEWNIELLFWISCGIFHRFVCLRSLSWTDSITFCSKWIESSILDFCYRSWCKTLRWIIF